MGSARHAACLASRDTGALVLSERSYELRDRTEALLALLLDQAKRDVSDRESKLHAQLDGQSFGVVRHPDEKATSAFVEHVVE